MNVGGTVASLQRTTGQYLSWYLVIHMLPAVLRLSVDDPVKLTGVDRVFRMELPRLGEARLESIGDGFGSVSGFLVGGVGTRG